MFRCGLCGGLSQPGQPAIHVVTERRPITQPDTGKPGTAIVKEVLAHDECSKLEAVAQAATQVANEGRARFQEKLFDRVRAMGAEEVSL